MEVEVGKMDGRSCGVREGVFWVGDMGLAVRRYRKGARRTIWERWTER